MTIFKPALNTVARRVREGGVEAVLHLFERVDRTLLGFQGVNVVAWEQTLHGHAPAPSFTDGRTIWIERVCVEASVYGSSYDLLSLYGLNYHELAHVFYTPQIDFTSPAVEDRLRAASLNKEVFAKVYNMLEDQRIEKLLVARFARMRYYLMAAVSRYFFSLRQPSQVPSIGMNWQVHLCVAERRYIPAQFRAHTRQMMVDVLGKADTAKAESLIGRYCRLNIGDKVDVDSDAFQIVVRLAKLIESSDPVQLPTGCCSTDSAKVSVIATRKVRGVVKPQLPSKEEEDQEDAAALAEVGDPVDSDGDDGDDGDDAGVGGSSPGEEVDDSDELDDDSDGDKLGKKDGGKGETNGSDKKKGKGLGNRSSNPAYDAAKAMQEAMVAIVAKPEVQRDLKDVRRVVATALPNIPRVRYKRTTPVGSMLRKRRDDFVRVLSDYQDQVDPGWESGNSYGRINLNRVMQGDEYDTVFDSWREDRSDALDIEAYLLVDMSGSMASLMDAVSQATWVIRSALDTINAQVTVIGYETSASLLVTPGERAHANTYVTYPSGGGTEPSIALNRAAVALTESQHKHRIMIVLTDGQWVTPEKSRIHITAMRLAGVVTAMVFLDENGNYRMGRVDSAYRPPSHGCEHLTVIDQGLDLAKFTRQLMVDVIEKAVSR